jgi:hypothetical protein
MYSCTLALRRSHLRSTVEHPANLICDSDCGPTNFGNAAGSTLRRTLGCLLSEQLGIQLRKVGSGGRYTFTNPGEQVLDAWMKQHAFVTWVETSAPWDLELYLLSSGLRLPLNVDGNPWVEAVALVKAVRLKARQAADQLSVVIDSGGPRKVSTLVRL